MLPLGFSVALLSGFVMLIWLVFGAGDGGGDAAAIPNLAAPPVLSQSFAAASRPPPEALEAPEIKAPETRGASAGPDPIDDAAPTPGFGPRPVPGPLPSSPTLNKDRAAGPASAPIVDMAAPGQARAERPGEAAGGGYRVQLHALSSDAAVRREWPRLQKTHEDLLGGLSLKVVRTGSGPRQKSFYRMQIGTLASAAAAKKLCDRLKRRKLDCVIVRP
jgi:cell division septation protein DedD